MTVIKLEDYIHEDQEGQAHKVCFYGPVFHRGDGGETSLSICVRIEDGDIAGIMSTVVENGGIGRTDEDGVFHFLPWPCAAVEIQKVDPDSAESPLPTPPE